MSCSSLTIGRLRRDGPDDHAVAGGCGTSHHRRARGDRRSAPRRRRRPLADQNIAALIAAWRAEGLPLVHVGRQADRARFSSRAIAPPLDGEIVIVRNADKRLRRRRPRSQARRTRGDDAGPLRDARDPCARSVGAARGRPWLSGVCRRRRVPGGRHGRSQRPALAGGGGAGAVAGASQGRDCDDRRCRDGASGCGGGQGAPAARRRKGLTVRSEFNRWRTCAVLHATQSFPRAWDHFSATEKRRP